MFWHRFAAQFTGKNLASTPPAMIVDQMNEPRPLPMGRGEFEIWSERIISGALCSADRPSQKFVLANMLLHLGPTESFKADAHFIHSLRKFAVNEVADAVRREIRDARKAEEPAATEEPKSA